MSKFKHSTNAHKKLVGTFNKTKHSGKVAEKIAKQELRLELVQSDTFNPRQMSLFNDIILLLTESGTLQNVGLRFVEMFCIQYKIYMEAKNKVDLNGSTISVDMKYGPVEKKNPAIDVMNGAFSQMMDIANKFGFHPLAQSKINSPNDGNKGKKEKPGQAEFREV